MEDTVNNAVNGAVDIDTLIIYSLDDLRYDPLEDLGSDLASWLIEDLVDVSKFSIFSMQTYV